MIEGFIRSEITEDSTQPPGVSAEWIPEECKMGEMLAAGKRLQQSQGIQTEGRFSNGASSRFGSLNTTVRAERHKRLKNPII